MECAHPLSRPRARAEFLPALTGFRFVLALWVILQHLTGRGQSLEPLALSLPHPIYQLIRGGYLAVTTFFVLSGFVMVRSHGSMAWTHGNFLRYAAGRIARVYPVYILSIALVAPFILADRTPGKGSYLTAYALLIQGWLGTIPVNWNTPAWTLSCEMFFYLAFPLTAVLIRRPTWPKTLGMAAVACCLTRALWDAGVPDGVKPIVHLADFLMGIAAACAYDLAGRTRRKPCGAWLYLPASLLFVTLIGWPELLPGGIDLNTAVRPLNALILIGFALGGGVFARALSSKLAVYLGKSSYAMYLLHVPILWWYHRWSPAYSPVLYIAAVMGISALVYGLFEEPANRYLRRLIH